MSKDKKSNPIKRFLSDFKAFVMKGNILELAIAVIIGGAFGAIVTSLVNDIIMPLVTLAVGGVSVADWKWVITPETVDAATGAVVKAEAALRYGNFIQTIVNFLIIAFCLFAAIRVAMKTTGLFKRDSLLTKEEKKALKTDLKAEGKNIIEIRVAIAAAEKEKAARVKAEAEAAAAAVVPPETTDDILKDIRDLLRTQAATKDVEKTEE
ncbi:MAG: large conductance mechanosensitive channel protein MscL [Clostridiaceae bacterium]|jgi:large conductance mechanosensitive channel|nr:large conductance mechanosensitive channel protein MscL [Clostridiaceae bacterium]